MLTGKAVARAVRGHFLVDAALNTLLVCNTFNIPLPINTSIDDAVQTSDEPTGTEEQQENATRPDEPTCTEEQQENSTEPQPTDTDLELARELYKKLIDGARMIEEVKSADVLHKIAEKLESKQSCMQNQRTAVLWIQYMQYMHMVDILRTLIRAERTGNWKLHLQAVHDMLPYFAAAGHNPYAQSAYLYLQLMYDFQKEHPDGYTSFQDGLHVVRRCDRYWAELSTDLAIEQVLMLSVKTCGGLT